LPTHSRLFRIRIGAAGLAFIAGSGAALAADGGGAAASTTLFVCQVVVLMLVGRLVGEGMQRIGQPAVMGAIVGGILLGPSVFGLLWPVGQHALFPPDPAQKAMINGVAQFGVLMLLLLAGMETDLGLVRRVRRAAGSVSLTGIAIPFACGFLLGWFLPEALLPDPKLRLITALFLGTALSISSVKIVAMVVREMGFVRRNVGQVILASAVIDDTVGWIVIAITFGLASSGGLEIVAVIRTVALTLLFIGVSLVFGRRPVFWIIRWVNDRFRSELPVITAVLVIMGGMALITDAIGVHDVLGAFMAGILVGESPILTKQIDQQIRGLTTALFMPVFFGLSGLEADLSIFGDPRLLAIGLAIVAIASIGKFGGALLGGWMGGMSGREALALGFGMNARGSTEVIVASIGLSIGALSQDLFSMIVAMAVITTLVMPPTLRWALRRLPLEEAEKLRLDREAFEAQAFVPNLERLLLVADDGPKGRFAARLSGLLAGVHRIAVTTLVQRPDSEKEKPEDERPRAIVAAQAEAAAARAAEDDAGSGGAVDVVSVEAEALTGEAVVAEAKKGYDLLMVGVEPTGARGGGFAPQVGELVAGFSGWVAIAAARGVHQGDPMGGALDILVPVNGTAASRRAAEVAFALARAGNGSLRALYVAAESDAGPRRLFEPAPEEAGLKELAPIAEHYGVEMKTSIRVDVAPADAILRQARLGRHTLIVMGVRRRAGGALSFGEVADFVLESADRSILFVSEEQSGSPLERPEP
jgi:Kef-type K+ transport system membrane component KefB/nucleotide-binding universal stress UspA family protein